MQMIVVSLCFYARHEEQSIATLYVSDEITQHKSKWKWRDG